MYRRYEATLAAKEAEKAELKGRNEHNEDRVVRLHSAVVGLEQERDRLRAALEAVPEFVKLSDGWYRCLSCLGIDPDHAPTCSRQRALSKEGG